MPRKLNSPESRLRLGNEAFRIEWLRGSAVVVRAYVVPPRDRAEALGYIIPRLCSSFVVPHVCENQFAAITRNHSCGILFGHCFGARNERTRPEALYRVDGCDDEENQYQQLRYAERWLFLCGS